MLALLLTLGAPALATAGDSLLDRLSRLGQGFSESGTGGGQFLPLEQAFPVDARAAGPRLLEVEFDVQPGYYLYRDKFDFKLPADSAVRLAGPQIPAGEWKEDAEFGRVEVNKGRTTVRLPIEQRPPGGLSLPLTVSYQGCAEDGICYPPATTTLTLALAPLAAGGQGAELATPVRALPADPAGGAASAEALDARQPVPLSESEQVTRLLSAGIDAPTLMKFYGIGLLLAFTPCVFPMVPILSGIVVGRGQPAGTAHALTLSGVYVMAMALAYAAVGVLAGLFGQNLQAHAQNPYVLVVFALVFVLLALSMFGLYPLQLPVAWQSRMSTLSSRQRGGSVLGAAMMGLISAVVVGPCVAAPLAGTLAYIGLSGNALLGGAALFVMALGMGTPLLLVGTSAGRLLPHAGSWMEAIQRIFGVALLGVAIYLLSRILPGPAVLLLWSLLLVVSAVYMGALDPVDRLVSGWRRLWKGLSLAMLIYGFALIVGAAGGGSDPLRPLGGWRTADAVQSLGFTPVKGPEELRQRLGAARAEGQSVMLDFYADWCVECKRMERTTFADGRVQRRLEPVLLLKADVTDYDASDRALLRELGLHGPPATLFYGPEGGERRTLRLAGYVGPGDFLGHLDLALPR